MFDLADGKSLSKSSEAVSRFFPVDAHLKHNLVLEFAELVESTDPPSLFFIDLVEPFDLPVRLRPPDLAECVHDVILGEMAFEGVVDIQSVVLSGIDELRAVIGDHLDDRNAGLMLLPYLFKEIDTSFNGLRVHLDRRDDHSSKTVKVPLLPVAVELFHVDGQQ